MTVLLHIVIAVFCAVECATGLSNPRGAFAKIIIFAALGLIHGVVPALTPQSMMWTYASESSILMAAVMALIGVVMFSAGWRIYERGHPQWAGPSPGLQEILDGPNEQRGLRRVFWFFGIATASAWLLGMIATAGSVRAAFEAGRFEHRFGGHVYLNVILTHVSNLMVIPGFLCFFLPRRHRLIGIIFVLSMATLLFFGSKGARTASMGLLGSLVMGYTLRHRLAPHRFVAVVIGGTVFLILAIGLYEVRKVMSYRSLREMGEILVSAETYQDALARDPLNYHQFLVAAVQHFPKDHPYINGDTYLRLLIFYLPQRYFPNFKPEDPHITFARGILGTSGDALRIMPTLMGNGHINFHGLPGVVVVSFLNGLLFGFAAQKMRQNLLWFLVIGPAFVRFVLMTVRGETYEILTACLSSFGVVWLGGRMCGLSFRAAKARILDTDQLVLYGDGVPAAQPYGVTAGPPATSWPTGPVS